MLDKINRRAFLVNSFKTGYPEVHELHYARFVEEVPVSKREAFYGAEDLEYIRFLQENKVAEFAKLSSEQVKGILR